MFEFIVIPVLLALESLVDYSLYAVFSISFVVCVFVLAATPYAHKIDNIRLIVHRVLILALCCSQIVFKLKKNEQAK